MSTGRRRHMLLKSHPICSVNTVVGDHGHHMSNIHHSTPNVVGVALLRAARKLHARVERRGAIPAPDISNFWRNCRELQSTRPCIAYEIIRLSGTASRPEGSMTIDHVSTVHTVTNGTKWFEHRFQYVKRASANRRIAAIVPKEMEW